MPVGLWISRTADDVLLMCWPPAPDERNTCISMSASSTSMSTSPSCSIGTTDSAANAVCRLPCALNGLMRTSRCTPRSALQPAVRVATLHDELDRRQAGFGSWRRVLLLDVEAVALGPAHVHAVEHLGPVLRVGAALARRQRAQRVVLVVLAGEQRPQLELVEASARRHRSRLDLGDLTLVVFLARQLGERLGIVELLRRATRTARCPPWPRRARP